MRHGRKWFDAMDGGGPSSTQRVRSRNYSPVTCAPGLPMFRTIVGVTVASVLIADYMPRRRRPSFLPSTDGEVSEETIAYNLYWNSLLQPKHELERVRDGLYGCRVEDSPREDASFMVRCPCVGIMGDGLTISQARQLVEAHVHAA